MRRAISLGFVALSMLGWHAETWGYFELTEIGARGLAMGRAFAPVADDASGIYWNPAGLVSLGEPQILLTNYRPFLVPDLALNFAGFALPTRHGSFGVAWSHLGLANVVAEDLFYAGVARGFRIGERLGIGVGANLKLYRVGYEAEATAGIVPQPGSASDLGADFGIRLRLEPRFEAGWVVRNLGRPSFDLVPGSGATKLDAFGEAGVAYQWHPESKIAVALVEGAESRFTPVAGTEILFYDVFALRLGAGDLQFFGGVGIQSGRWVIDTAFATHNTLGVSTMVSLIVKLGGSS